MAKVRVTEYTGLGSDENGSVQAVAGPATAEQAVTLGTGAIGTLGAITAGSLYTNGSYSNVALTGGTGSGATANIVVSGAAVTSVTLVNPGTGYTVADALSAAAANIGGTGSGFSIPVATIASRSAAFNPATTVIRVHAEAICAIAVGGTAPVATAGLSARLIAGQTEYFRVAPGDKIAVVVDT